MDRDRRRRENLSDDLPKLYEIFLCEVATLQPYGIFVKIPGFKKNGLVHKTQMANAKVEDPSDMVEPREKVYCKVINIEPDGGKIGMSMKVVNQSTGQDLDPGHVQTSLDEQRRKTGHVKEIKGIELGAVLDTTCKKCGGKGHLAQDCFHIPGNKTYELLPSLDYLASQEAEEKKLAAERKKMKKAAKKEKKRLKKEKKKLKKKLKKRKYSTSSSSDSDSEEDAKKKRKYKHKKKKTKYASSSDSSSDSGDKTSDSEQDKRSPKKQRRSGSFRHEHYSAQHPYGQQRRPSIPDKDERFSQKHDGGCTDTFRQRRGDSDNDSHRERRTFKDKEKHRDSIDRRDEILDSRDKRERNLSTESRQRKREHCRRHSGDRSPSRSPLHRSNHSRYHEEKHRDYSHRNVSHSSKYDRH